MFSFKSCKRRQQTPIKVLQLIIIPRESNATHRKFDDPLGRKFSSAKAYFQSLKFSERSRNLLFMRENVALDLNRMLRITNHLLCKILSARKIVLSGNRPFVFIVSCQIAKKIFLPSGRATNVSKPENERMTETELY